MKYYTRFNTSLCKIILVGNEEGISNLHLNTGECKRVFEISEDWVRNDSFFKNAVEQVMEYCEGKRKEFNLLLNPEGTDFQKRVWKALSRIPYGEVRSYKDIAVEIGNEKACRAVGMANSKNPIPLIVPCHRVVGANGKLVGFALGLEVKKKLLDLEGIS